MNSSRHSLFCFIHFMLHLSKLNAFSLWKSQRIHFYRQISITSSMKKSPYEMMDPIEKSKCIHIGNIDWNVPLKEVEDYLASMSEDVSVVDIRVKEATTKKRDVGKCHGGSAQIEFESHDDASKALDTFQNLSNEIGDIPIGSIKSRWALNHTIDKSRKQHIEEKNEISEERILHRKMRAEKYARQRQAIAKRTDDLLEYINSSLQIKVGIELETLDSSPLSWYKEIPDEIDPMRGGGLRKGTERGKRKQAQVECFYDVLYEILNEKQDKRKDMDNRLELVADLGSGAGNLSLPLAWLLKENNSKYKVLAIDINKRSLQRLEERAERIQVELETLDEDLFNLINDVAKDEDPLKYCSAIVSLHACGAASDLAIENAVRREIPFIISPCCVGKAKIKRRAGNMPTMSAQRSGTPDSITYPRSSILQEIVGDEDYNLILSAADYSASERSDINSDKEMKHINRGKLAKNLVETDRLMWADERNYTIRLLEIPRLGEFYPKRQILLGAKAGSGCADRILKLKTLHQDALSNNDVK